MLKRILLVGLILISVIILGCNEEIQLKINGEEPPQAIETFPDDTREIDTKEDAFEERFSQNRKSTSYCTTHDECVIKQVATCCGKTMEFAPACYHTNDEPIKSVECSYRDYCADRFPIKRCECQNNTCGSIWDAFVRK